MHDPLRPVTPPEAHPGSPDALDHGCLCSVLLNRLPDPDAGRGFVDPLCPLHGPAVTASGPTPTAEPAGRPDP